MVKRKFNWVKFTLNPQTVCKQTSTEKQQELLWVIHTPAMKGSLNYTSSELWYDVSMGLFFNHLFLSLAMIKTYAARLFSVGSRPLARRIWSQRLRSSNMIIYLCRILRSLRYLSPAIKPRYQYLVSRFQNT